MEKIFASIITIGDELLIGQVIDTNSAFIAQELNKMGIHVKHRIAVGDVWDDIWHALEQEQKHAQLIFITGGLGPTADDITKPLLCQFFGGKMILDEETLAHIQYLFEKVFRRTGPLLERNIKQAEVPDVCTILKNEKGTAPGMQFEKDGKLFFALPGVPHEMKWLVQHKILPILQEKFSGGIIEHRTLLTQGIGESMLAELIKEFEESLPPHIKLAYLPKYGMVRLRLSSFGHNKLVVDEEINKYFNELKHLVEAYLVVDEDIPLEQAVARLLLERKETVATAESCTGGHIASLITQHAGASAYFTGSVVCYDNRIKTELLGVSNDILKTVGAVSKETVEQMALSVRKLMNTDYSIAVSGIMGPSGATDEKPVGMVWIAVSNKEKVETKEFHFRFDRARNIQFTAINALNMLRILILNK